MSETQNGSLPCVGQPVIHRKYGMGKIKSRDGNTMTISFREYGARTFLYPQGFDQYLKASDPDFARAVQEELAAAKQAEEQAAVAHQQHLQEVTQQIAQARMAEKQAKRAATRSTTPRRTAGKTAAKPSTADGKAIR